MPIARHHAGSTPKQLPHQSTYEMIRLFFSCREYGTQSTKKKWPHPSKKEDPLLPPSSSTCTRQLLQNKQETRLRSRRHCSATSRLAQVKRRAPSEAPQEHGEAAGRLRFQLSNPAHPSCQPLTDSIFKVLTSASFMSNEAACMNVKPQKFPHTLYAPRSHSRATNGAVPQSPEQLGP